MNEKYKNNLPHVIIDDEGRKAMITAVTPDYFIVDFVQFTENGWMQAPVTLLGNLFTLSGLLKKDGEGFTGKIAQTNPLTDEAKKLYERCTLDVGYLGVKQLERTISDWRQDKPHEVLTMIEESERHFAAAQQYLRVVHAFPVPELMQGVIQCQNPQK